MIVTIARSYEDEVDGLVLVAKIMYDAGSSGRMGRDPDDSEPPCPDSWDVLEVFAEFQTGRMRPVADEEWAAWGLDADFVRDAFDNDADAVREAVDEHGRWLEALQEDTKMCRLHVARAIARDAREDT